MRLVAILALALVVYPGPVLASEPPQCALTQRAWELEDRERIALRFDPRAAATRRARAVAAGQTDVRENYNIVLGSENPELILPWELMQRLTAVYYPADDTQREKGQRILDRAARLGLRQDFFDRLSAVARPFFDAMMENGRLHRKMSTMAENDQALLELADEARRVNKLICPSRTAAIAAARREFGPAWFDRFLYEAVAPDAVAMFGPVSESGGDSLLWVEGGCQ